MSFIDDISMRKTDNNLTMLYHKKEGTLFELNETASQIADIIASGITDMKQVANLLAGEYDSDYEDILDDVESIFGEFKEYGIIEEK